MTGDRANPVKETITDLGGCFVAATLQEMVTRDGIAKFVRGMKPDARKKLKAELEKYDQGKEKIIIGQ
jgi:hypothetical protein